MTPKCSIGLATVSTALIAMIAVLMVPTPSRANGTCPCFTYEEAAKICRGTPKGLQIKADKGLLSVYCDWSRLILRLSPGARLYKATCEGPNTGVNGVTLKDNATAMGCLELLLNFSNDDF